MCIDESLENWTKSWRLPNNQPTGLIIRTFQVINVWDMKLLKVSEFTRDGDAEHFSEWIVDLTDGKNNWW